MQTLHIFIQGYGVITGQLCESLMGLVATLPGRYSQRRWYCSRARALAGMAETRKRVPENVATAVQRPVEASSQGR